MKYKDPVYAFTEMSVAELREVAEREAEREIKSEADYERAVKAGEMLVELWDMEQEAIDYGYGINTGAARPSDLITFIDHRKALEELRNRNKPAPEPQAQEQPPAIPTRPAHRKRWEVIADIIRPLVDDGITDFATLDSEVQRRHKGGRVGESQLRQIIRAVADGIL